MGILRTNEISGLETPTAVTGSVLFDGTGDSLTIASTNDFAFGTGDFTIEMWVYHTDLTGQQTYFGDTYGNTAGIYTYKTTNNEISLYDTAQRSLSAQNVIQLSTWHHIAWTRENGVLKAFLDGVKVDEDIYAGDFTITQYYIGDTAGTSSGEMVGHISNLRVIKGQALYTTNFTPPTRELEVIPNTVLLACQSTTKTDEEKTGKTITVNGNAVANELTPGLLTNVVKSGGSSAITGSVEFDDNDYLTLASSDDFNLGTGDFTIEFWIHPQKDFVSFPTIFQIDATDNANKLLINFRNTSTLGLTNGSTVFATNTGFNLDSWFHVAVVRESGVSKIYKNGISGGDTACTADFSNSGSSNIFIGWDSTTADSEKYNGFISNLRIIKGTALYTSNFIPPTRKLTKLPGTVLLCCQDSNDPTTEATGKTITGYGDLVQVGISTNLADSGSYTDGSTGSGVATFVNNVGIITGTDSSNRGILYKTVSVIQGNKYEFSFRSTDASTNGKAGVDSNDGTNDVLDDVTNTPDLVYFSGSTVPNLDTTTGLFRQTFTATTNEAVLYFQEIGAGTLQVTDITLTAIDGRKGSDFTPSVGSDDSVEFAGPTTINTENYFYLPTGPTEQRDSGAGVRGISMGGSVPAGRLNSIEYINISTTGNAKEFGELQDKINQQAGASSSTRGICAGGSGTSPVLNEIVTVNYFTIASTGDANDFGDLTLARRLLAGCSSQTRGIFAGGYDAPNKYNTMDYISIASTGDAIDFGDMVADGQTPSGRYGYSAYASPTRGVWHGGYGYPAYRNIIDYVTIASTGNTKDFGDSSISNYYMGGCSNSIRGISGGAFNPGPSTHLNLIEYTTIATTGNAQDFGDLIQKGALTSACASQIRGVFLGGVVGGSESNSISYITIMTMGNAIDFGDLTSARSYNAGCSNGHGGLG